MNFIGDYFALGLILVLCIAFFDGKHSLNQASKCFVNALILTALTAVTDLVAGRLMETPTTPLWLNMTANTLFFLINLLTTSTVAQYLFTKILEHSHDRHCMTNARIGLIACLGVYAFFLAVNLKTGWLFYFDGQNRYCRGPLNSIGYFITLCQMVLVMICYFRNRKNTNNSLRRALIQTFPIIVLCIVIQRANTEIMLNSLIMSMVMTVLFLTFQGQRPGVHELTKLNDRHRFFASAKNHIHSDKAFQVFLINLKNYSVINQKYGHVFGDEVLYHFAFALERLFSGSEAFHMNGTVFSLILPYQSQYAADKHVKMLLDFMDSGVTCAGQHVGFDYVAVEYIAGEQENDAEEFYEKLEFASARAYQQKERFIRYTPALGEEMQRRRYLIERMQSIDKAHGFQVWYQPILCLSSGRFCSMEALIRLQEPDGSYISPAEFIPVAEEMGLIAPITWFVLDEACRLLKNHPEMQIASIGVNLPMAQLLDKSFMARLNSIVDRYGVERSSIGLEFTERSIPDNFRELSSSMNEFAAEGYRFYLDDFGEGYSNFNCLLQLPFHFIKLDANLIRMDLGQGEREPLGLTRKLTEFLHEIRMNVIAEGVETERDEALLNSYGVDKIQGYIHARPMPEPELLPFYEKHASDRNVA